MNTQVRKIVLALLIAMAGVGAAAQVQQDCIGPGSGCLDSSFGGGWVTTNIPPKNSSITDVAIQNLPQGQRIVAVGYGYSFGQMAAYKADGSLDSCFGDLQGCTKGIVQLPLNYVEAVAVQTVQANNYLVAVGMVTGKTPQMGVARYTAEGLPDRSFGNNGLLVVPFGSKPLLSSGAQDVAVQADGKIVVTGNYGNWATVVRLNTNGTLDSSFASGGRFIYSVGNSYPRRVALQPVPIVVNGTLVTDVMIVVVGSARPDYKGRVVPPNSNAVLRLTSSGILDTTFGIGGVVTTNFLGYSGSFNDLAVDADNRLVAVGYAKCSSALSDCVQLAVARYDVRGNPDLSFNGSGKLTRAVEGANVRGSAVAIQANGMIRVAGSISPGTIARVAIWRFDSYGNTDGGFGHLGLVDSNVLGNGGIASAFAPQPNNMFIVGGTAGQYTINNIATFALARYYE